ncbi:MAG TPA: OmpA family protein [Xenococcaceae cyanobacterium]
MSDSLDDLLNLLLDLEPPDNKPHAPKPALAQQQNSAFKPKNELSSAKVSPPSPKTQLESPKPPEPESKVLCPERTEPASTSSDHPIQAITSALSNLTNSQQTPPRDDGISGIDRDQNSSNGKTSASASQNMILEDWLNQKEKQLNELAESMNNLIPLMVELLSVKVNDSREVILQTIIPVIDQAIEARSVQDLEKMANAIAKVLPNAITQEIKIQPQSLGKAIAPEVALSIEEQIRLDRDAISRALSSEMGKAIKAQIELEKDAMVDALYPVIGNTISKYLAEELQRINNKVENTLSPEGISRKIRAKMQGVSEAELILRESLSFSVRAIFLIEKDSGLIIRDIQPNEEKPLESELVAGMLTAIRSFANDCIASGSELHEIDYGNFHILLEVAGYCYLAVVINGTPNQRFRDRIRKTLSEIVLKYGTQIENYEGNPDSIPQSINLLLKDLTVKEVEANAKRPKKSFTALFWLGGILFAIVLIPWVILQYRTAKTARITQEVATQLDSNPQLSVYRLRPQVEPGKIIITGKVPTSYLRNVAQESVAEIATEENLNLDNQIIAVNVPPDPTVTAQEVIRVNNLLNQLEGVAINTDYQDAIVTVTGFVLEAIPTQTFTTAFAQIPGVEQVIFTVASQLPTLDTRIYFNSGESEVKTIANSSKIESIKQFLAQYPTLNLRIIGHSDRQGTTNTNRSLALARANNTAQQLIDQGIIPNRLEVVASLQSPPDISPDQPLWLSRCVRFEPFIPQ